MLWTKCKDKRRERNCINFNRFFVPRLCDWTQTQEQKTDNEMNYLCVQSTMRCIGDFRKKGLGDDVIRFSINIARYLTFNWNQATSSEEKLLLIHRAASSNKWRHHFPFAASNLDYLYSRMSLFEQINSRKKMIGM